MLNTAGHWSHNDLVTCFLLVRFLEVKDIHSRHWSKYLTACTTSLRTYQLKISLAFLCVLSGTKEAWSSRGMNGPRHYIYTPSPPPRHFASWHTDLVSVPLGMGRRPLGKGRDGVGEGRRRRKQKLRFGQGSFWRKLGPGPQFEAGFRTRVRAQRGRPGEGLCSPRSSGPRQLQGFQAVPPALARRGGEPEVTPSLSLLSLTAAYHRGPRRPSQ